MEELENLNTPAVVHEEKQLSALSASPPLPSVNHMFPVTELYTVS